jgi:hypothetical protein
LELEFELELLLELLLEFELELLLEFELELLLWLELELLFWFELDLFDEARFSRLIVRLFRLIVRRFPTARARHHSIDFPSIFRSTTGTELRAALREMGTTVAWSSSDRADTGPSAAPTAMPRAPSAPA